MLLFHRILMSSNIDYILSMLFITDSLSSIWTKKRDVSIDLLLLKEYNLLLLKFLKHVLTFYLHLILFEINTINTIINLFFNIFYLLG